MDSDEVAKYLSRYSGKELLKRHDLSEEGVWRVLGEDPNCDMGGHHENPFLGIFEGTLEDAIHWGVNQPNFWQWGAGGEFIKVRNLSKTSNSKRASLHDQLKERSLLDEDLNSILNSLVGKNVKPVSSLVFDLGPYVYFLKAED